MDLTGKVAWLTGGISGIGAATSIAMHKAGAKLLLTDINVEKGAQFVKQFGDDAIFIKADNRIYAELDAAVNKGVEKFGRLDILFNSAGVGNAEVIFADSEEAVKKGLESFENVVRVNLIGSFYTAQIAAAKMKSNAPDENGERGNIIFVSSMAADKVFSLYDERVAGTMYAYGYGASKAGILGLNRDLSITLSHHGIRVNTIKPGYILTPMTDNGHSDMLHLPYQLFPKVAGRPENIASMALEIVKNPYINRAELSVDAGIVG